MRPLPTATDAGRHALPGVAMRLVSAWGWMLAWHAWYEAASCLIALAFLVPVVFFILLGITEEALLRRRATLSVYLRPGARLFRLLRGGIILVAWQMLKGVVLGLLLLIGAASWAFEIWMVLGLDALLVAALYRMTVVSVGSQARAGLEGMLARRALAPLNSTLLLLAVILAEVNAPHPNLRDLTLIDAIATQVGAVNSACDGVAILARAAMAVDALRWWLAETQLTRAELLAVAPVAWIAFVATSLGFVWAYTRLLLGVLVSPSLVRGLLSNSDNEGAMA